MKHSSTRQFLWANTCMTEKVFINKRGVIDLPYQAQFQGKTVNLYAPTHPAAKQKALEHFKPKKRDMGLIFVTPIEKPTE